MGDLQYLMFDILSAIILSTLMLGAMVGMYPKVIKWPLIIKNVAICVNFQLAANKQQLITRTILNVAVAILFLWLGLKPVAGLLAGYTLLTMSAWIIRADMISEGKRQLSLTYVDFKKEGKSC